LDEADHMLDMGFIHDIKKIVAKLPIKRQSLFFSATMPQEIVKLSEKILGNPFRVTIKPEQATAERVEQALYYVGGKSKAKLLVHLLLKNPVDSALVFSRTKHGANKIVKILEKANINSDAIHGNKSQSARQRALENFKNGDISVLVATDIAARGIDISDLALVVNYDIPNISETYIHRIGRTGRASASGIAISFCEKSERSYIRDIQNLIGQKIPVITDHPFVNDVDDEEEKTENPRQNQNGRGKRSTFQNKSTNAGTNSPNYGGGNRSSNNGIGSSKPWHKNHEVNGNKYSNDSNRNH